MNNGDLVRGVPANEDFRKEYPFVVGRYERSPSIFMGDAATIDLVWVDSKQGIRGTVDCSEVQPAKAGDKETVL